MLLCFKNNNDIFKTISKDLAESLKVPPDLSFICDDGKMVHTHRTLLTTFSPFLRSIFASSDPVATSYSRVLSMPGTSSSALEQVVQMISKPWTQEVLSLNLEQIMIITALDIPVSQALEKSMKNSEITEATIEFKDVGSSLLIGSTSNITDISHNCIGKDLQLDNNGSKEPKCSLCDIRFRDFTLETVEEITIHLGEAHFEMDLQVEQLRRFPRGIIKCEECDLKITSDYVQREHILLKHPWPLLKMTLEEIVSQCVQDVPEEGQFSLKSMEEAAHSASNTGVDGNANGLISTLESYSSNDTLKKMEEFINSLNRAPLNEECSNTEKETPLDGLNEVDRNKASIHHVNTSSPSNLSRTTVSCPKCIQKWTYNAQSRMSDLKSRIKTHVVDIHFEEELKVLIQNSFHGDTCQMCGKSFDSLDLKKKHIRKVHNALESDVMSLVESCLGKHMHRKDPIKKRKGSPVATFGNFKIAKNLTHQNISRSNDLINDNLEEISSLSKIQSKLCLEFSDSEDDIFSSESKACNDIQLGIEFSDSEEEN